MTKILDINTEMGCVHRELLDRKGYQHYCTLSMIFVSSI